jgi:hypothetical protein
LLASVEYAGAARFFLNDLYSDKDYSLRDAQFARIAGALQRLFPKQVVATAVTMAQLHILTEELDRQMAVAWADFAASAPSTDAVVTVPGLLADGRVARTTATASSTWCCGWAQTWTN